MTQKNWRFTLRGHIIDNPHGFNFYALTPEARKRFQIGLVIGANDDDFLNKIDGVMRTYRNSMRAAQHNYIVKERREKLTSIQLTAARLERLINDLDQEGRFSILINWGIKPSLVDQATRTEFNNFQRSLQAINRASGRVFSAGAEQDKNLQPLVHWLLGELDVIWKSATGTDLNRSRKRYRNDAGSTGAFSPVAFVSEAISTVSPCDLDTADYLIQRYMERRQGKAAG